MAYNSVRIIAYQVGTVGTKNNVDQNECECVYGIDPGEVESPPKLYGDTNGLPKDAQTRIERLIKVIELAYNSFKDQNSNETLKVFLAPEFYFRPNNNKYAYTQTEYKKIREVLTDTLCYLDIGHNWLIYAGTIVWCDARNKIPHAANKRLNTDSINDNTDIYFNTCLMLQKRGGVLAQPQNKVHVHSGDGIGSIDVRNRLGLQGAAASEAFSEYTADKQFSKRQMSMGAIRFALEICVEHGSRFKALRRYLKNKPNSKFPDEIDLHFLVTAGKRINPKGVSAKVGGFFVRCDGSYDQIDNTQCEIFKVTGYQQSRIMGADDTATTEAVEFRNAIPIDEDHGGLYLTSPKGCENKWFAQSINISDPLKVS